MLIQIIIYPREQKRSEIVNLETLLESKGYRVTFPENSSKRGNDFSALNQSISSDVEITIVMSGIYWMKLSKQVDFKLLPNTIVVTSNPGLQFIWEIKPVVVVWKDKSFLNNILFAVKELSGKQIVFPARLSSLQRGDFGWTRRAVMEEPYAIKVWELVKKHILPGYKFKTWSVIKGFLKVEYEIIEITENSIVAKSKTAKSLQVIPKEDFFTLAIEWEDYKEGDILRSEWRNKTWFSSYIIGILHWMDCEGHLEKIKKELNVFQ
jgi:hypothetical protein